MTGINYLKFNKECAVFKSGEIIFRQGDTGDFMYGIISGEVHIEYDWNIIDVVNEGGFIGEMALVGDNIRSATVVAASDCVLTLVDKQCFLWLVQETPTFATQVMQVMASRIQRLHSLAS